MKKTTACIILSLVMCLCMAFPASAVYYWPAVHDNYISLFNKIEASAVSTIPSSYKYKLVTSNGSLKTLTVLYSSSSTISVGSVVYRYYCTTTTNPVLTGSLVIDSIAPTVSGLEDISIRYSGIGSTSVRYYILNLSTANLPALNDYPEYDYACDISLDTSELQELLFEADKITDIGYTEPTWTRFSNARMAGHNLLARPTYTALEVQTVVTELISATSGLQILPDTSELRALLIDADLIEDDGYTPSSWSRFIAARSAGHNFLMRTDFTADDVHSVYIELLLSMHELERVPVNPPVVPPVEPTDPNIPNLPVGAEKYLDIAGGFSVGHLMPVQDAIMQNLAAGRKFGAWVYVAMLIPFITVMIVRRTIHIQGEADAVDLNTPSHRSKAYKGTIIKPVQTGEKYTDW